MGTGAHANAWKGGRVVSRNGYVTVLVGRGHHLADQQGRAYEHRVVAEQKLGRVLLPGEIVHHIDGDRHNNDPENLQVFPARRYHVAQHRSVRRTAELQRPDEPNVRIPCACGCGRTLMKYDAAGRPRKFIHGHSGRK